jgi:hypothetical protein
VTAKPLTEPTYTSYDADIIAWANEQARLLRAGRFEQLDIEHIAEEIEDVSKSEQRELANRMSLLLAQLLKWQYQPERRGASWRATIRAQRRSVELRLKRTPSLKPMLRDADWWEQIWADALALAASETGLGPFPAACPWSIAEVLDHEWLPRASGVDER